MTRQTSHRSARLAGILILLGWASCAVAEPVFPPGSGVGLEPPSGMSVSREFLGFQKGLGSILITELPSKAFVQINGSRPALAAKFDNPRTEEFDTGKVSGFVIRGSQRLGERVYRKWAVVIGGASETALITVQIPNDMKEPSDAAIEAALRSMTLRERPGKAEQIAALPFVVGDSAGFRTVSSLMGSTLGFTEGPKDVDPEAIQPSITISTSLGHAPDPVDHVGFAKRVAMSLKALKALKATSIAKAEPLTANGAEWVEVAGKAGRGKAEMPIDFAMYIRFGTQDFITAVCTAPVGNPACGARFRKLALSIHMKP